MEMKLLTPEDLTTAFKSKQDLYNILTVDLKYFLPSFEKCPMHFLHEILAGSKKMVKLNNVSEIIVLRYKELSVEHIWPLVKDVADLNCYFPNYTESQLPDKRFMYAILCTFRNDVLANIINDARKQISLLNCLPKEDLVHINSQILEEIASVVAQKVTRGNAVFLLRKSAKLQSKRKAAKQFQISPANFDRKQEKHSKEEEDGMV